MCHFSSNSEWHILAVDIFINCSMFIHTQAQPYILEMSEREKLKNFRKIIPLLNSLNAIYFSFSQNKSQMNDKNRPNLYEMN